MSTPKAGPYTYIIKVLADGTFRHQVVADGDDLEILDRVLDKVRRDATRAVDSQPDAAGLSAKQGVTVEGIMDLFDESVEASIEHGDENEAQDWLDIKDVGKEFRARLTQHLLISANDAPPSVERMDL